MKFYHKPAFKLVAIISLLLILTIAIIIFLINRTQENRIEPISYPVSNAVSYPVNTSTALPTEVILPTVSIEPETKNTKIFTSDAARFSIELPKNMIMTEINGYTIFSFEDYIPSVNDNPYQTTQPQLIVGYFDPNLGAGGGCPFVNKNETIAGQAINTCESETEFRAAYFDNPNAQIRYQLGTVNLSIVQKELIAKAVRETLKFN